MSKRTQQKITALYLGCYRSPFSVHPANWDKAGASTKKDWYFFYRFYDPAIIASGQFKEGKLIIVKAGINRLKNLMERRQLIKELIAIEQEEIDIKGFNPITQVYMKPPEEEAIDYEIHPSTPLLEALQLALEKKNCSPNTKKDLRSVLKYVSMAATQLRFHLVEVKDIRKRHIKKLLEHTGMLKESLEKASSLKTGKPAKDVWTANNYNFYRSHLMMLFDELEEWETIESNPVHKVTKKIVVVRKRATLSDEEREMVDTHLRENHYNFWRFMILFFKSGSRVSEILKVKVKDVDLNNQVFRAIRNKGKSAKEVDYTIVDSALPIWEELIKSARSNDFVFSTDLVPGLVLRKGDFITYYWEKHVKKVLGIEADFYSLKHLHTTGISEKAGIAKAAEFNNESSEMIRRHYDIDYNNRIHQTTRVINIPFVPVKKTGG